MLRLLFETLGAHALLAAAILGFRARTLDPTRFAVIAGVGAFYLYLDDVFDLHVWLANVLSRDFGLQPPPGINHLDDLVVMVTALAGVVVVSWYRTHLIKDTVFASLFGASLLLFMFALAVDAGLDPSATAAWWSEETAEVAASGLMAVAFYRRWKWLGAAENVRTPTTSALLPELPGGE